MIVLDALVAVGLLVGSLLTLLAAVGLHRLPDVFCRMHAATKPATLGLLLILVATALALRTSEALIKLSLVLALQFLTTPVGAHMISRAAYGSGNLLSDATVTDELADAPSR